MRPWLDKFGSPHNSNRCPRCRRSAVNPSFSNHLSSSPSFPFCSPSLVFCLHLSIYRNQKKPVDPEKHLAVVTTTITRTNISSHTRVCKAIFFFHKTDLNTKKKFLTTSVTQQQRYVTIFHVFFMGGGCRVDWTWIRGGIQATPSLSSRQSVTAGPLSFFFHFPIFLSVFLSFFLSFTNELLLRWWQGKEYIYVILSITH